MTEAYAYIACLILAALAVFQLALMLGAPIGKFAWGGQHKVLPAKLRIGSVVSILLYAVFAVFALDKAGVTNIIRNDSVVEIGMWVITGYFFIGIAVNAISRSKPERMVMTPTALALAVLFLIVTLN